MLIPSKKCVMWECQDGTYNAIIVDSSNPICKYGLQEFKSTTRNFNINALKIILCELQFPALMMKWSLIMD